MDALLLRRSVRKFKDTLIPYEDLLTLCKYGEAAPTARNQRSREYIIIENKELIKELAKCYVKSSMVVEKANQIIAVICKDLDTLPATPFAYQDAAYAAENIMVKAAEMGIGTVLLGTYPLEERYKPVKELLKLDDNKIPFTLICLGYPEDSNAFFDKEKFSLDMVKHIGE